MRLIMQNIFSFAARIWQALLLLHRALSKKIVILLVHVKIYAPEARFLAICKAQFEGEALRMLTGFKLGCSTR